MKKILALSLIMAVSVMGGQAWAAVGGTAHDMTIVQDTLADFGVCSACHIPHKAAGARLWPTDMSGAPAARGTVGALCSYCHDPATGVVVAARTAYPFVDQFATTHGMTKAGAPDGAADLDANLPYIPGTVAMQCTSCHNVHDTTAADAFLQDDIDVICARCHPGRQFVGGAASTAQGAWGAYYGYDPAATNGNPGSHPVGTDVFGDGSQHDITGDGTADPDSPIVTTAIGVADYLATAATPTTYNLGPKLIDGGTTWQAGNGIGCVTCHAPHGIDSDDHATQAGPFSDVLATNQSEMGGHANGNTDPNNTLCEACHRGGITGFASTYFPNPGATGYSHPVDDYYLLADAGVAGVPAGWPVGDGAENPGGPDIICESCHMPHPLAATDADNLQPDPLVATNTHILRGDDTGICDACHTGTVPDHHPVGAGLMDGTLFDSTRIGDGDTDMDCADCHNGQGAHNWTAAGAVGLDEDWVPWDNARAADTAAGGPNYIPDTSTECINCHTANGRFSPTRPNVAGEYQDAGDASHFLGGIDLSGWAIGGTAATTTNFTTASWASTGWSRMAGAAAATAIFVCESCHELEPDKNSGVGGALLLHDFSENIAEARSALCEGCHSANATALGAPHPMSGDTISRAVSAGRGTTTLITGGGSFADLGANGNTTYPAADQMNCDSCHQVHDAQTNSGTYILESTAAAGDITGTPAGTVTVTSPADGAYSWANMEYDTTEAAAARLDYQPFCNLCHSSGS